MESEGIRVVSAEPQPIPVLDWQELRRLSLHPGGFKEKRVELWSRLLNVDPPSSVQLAAHDSTDGSILDATSNVEEDGGKSIEEPHPDERQIQLDTDRSFVLYPVVSMDERMEKQGELNELIVKVFRKRRRLSYFQGYHDIVSVLFLTLPQELQLPCVERLSLHRVRDSMGASLEPVVGLLRVLQHVLKLADPGYAELLEQNAPLPYFALSNLLTLFSHDMPTLSLIQHVFDYLLCRPPISAVYLAAALILIRKEEVERLQQEGEEGMIHSLLSALPYISDGDDPPQDEVSNEAAANAEGDQPDSERVDQLTAEVDDDDDVSTEGVEGEVSSADSTAVHSEEPSISEGSTVSVEGEDTLVEPLDGADDDGKVSFYPALGESAKSDSMQEAITSEDTAEVHKVAEARSDEDITTSQPVSDGTLSSGHVRENESGSFLSDELPHKPRVSLSSLLERADELYSLYPPSHPAVALPSVMGPQSTMLTWSENPSELPADDEAELMVTQPSLIVLPPPEEDDDWKAEEEEKETRKAGKRRRRKLRKPVRIGSVVVEQRTVVASAVLVLSVAMAVYGLQAAPERHHTASRELKRMSKYVGGLVVGLGGRLLDRLFAER